MPSGPPPRRRGVADGLVVTCHGKAGKGKEKESRMNLQEAIAYGKRTGVRYYVKNSRGGLVGGTKTYEQAVDMKNRYEAKMANDPFDPGLKAYVVEA